MRDSFVFDLAFCDQHYWVNVTLARYCCLAVLIYFAFGKQSYIKHQTKQEFSQEK